MNCQAKNPGLSVVYDFFGRLQLPSLGLFIFAAGPPQIADAEPQN
jgi:hypothetical protein